jgi:hypothetical protein
MMRVLAVVATLALVAIVLMIGNSEWRAYRYREEIKAAQKFSDIKLKCEKAITDIEKKFYCDYYISPASGVEREDPHLSLLGALGIMLAAGTVVAGVVTWMHLRKGALDPPVEQPRPPSEPQPDRTR